MVYCTLVAFLMLIVVENVHNVLQIKGGCYGVKFQKEYFLVAGGKIKLK